MVDTKQVIDEFALRQYRDQAGVYFIQCYDGVIKIGCSKDLYSRLVSYQGVYWQNRILKIWCCNSPMFLEQQLHLVLGIELKQIRKGKYELFKLTETDDQRLEQIIERVDERAIEIMRQMDEAVNQNFDDDISMQVQNQLDMIETQSNMQDHDQSVFGNSSVRDSVQESETSGTRVNCKFNGCDRRTTKGYCFKHHPDNASYNQKRYQEQQEKSKSRILGYLTQIEQLNGRIDELELQVDSLHKQVARYQSKIPTDQH